MGDSLVKSIPSDPEAYQRWLQSHRTLFAKWDDLLQRTLCIGEDQLRNIKSDRTLVGFLGEAFDERMCDIPIYNPGWAEWDAKYTYTINLDLEVFTIDNTAHYRLDKIPRDEWMRALDTDKHPYVPNKRSRRFVHPRLAPDESLDSLAVETLAFTPDDKAYWKSVPKRNVLPAIDDNLATSTSARIRLKLFRVFADAHFEALDAAILSWNTGDLPFREIVFFILCLAAGGSHLALVDQQRVYQSPAAAASFAAIPSDESPKAEKELISPLGVGFHMRDQPAGSAPESSKYWFEGALIRLVHPSYSSPDVLRKAKGDALRYGREACKRVSFNVLVFSIELVVLVRAFPDGSVDYSAPMPLFQDLDSGLSAQERYNEAWLEKVYEFKMARRAMRAADEKAWEKWKAAKEKDAKEKNNARKEAPTDEVTKTGFVEEQTRGSQAEENETPKIAITDGGSAVNDGPEKNGQLADSKSGNKSWSDSKDEAGTQEAKEERLEGVEGVTEATTDNYAMKQDQLTVGESVEKRPTPSKLIQDHVKEEKNEEGKQREEEMNDDDKQEAKQEENQGKVKEHIEEDGQVWTTNDPFLALVKFFEATIRETLKPTKETSQKLPIEIVENILGHDSDTKTYNACAKVSSTFRELCNKRSLFFDGVLFYHNLHDKGANLSPNVPQSEYRAVEIESGRQMDVEIRLWKKYGKDSNCRFVIGSVKNRKLFCPGCPLFIKGLDVPPPPKSDTGTTSYDFVLSKDITSDDSVISKYNLGEEEETAWTRTFREINVTVHSPAYTLCSFWKHLVKELFPEQASHAMVIREEPTIKDWFLPPNTRPFMINTSAYVHEVYQHLLYMRIKRESRYWATDLWDDIIAETKQALDSIDDDHRLTRDGIVPEGREGQPCSHVGRWT
ncbi:MAG: hypothetical protein Q9178_004740 [Gyalolechia marmorata]